MKALVSLKNWFTAPNGKQYKAVFGELDTGNENRISVGKVVIPVGNTVCMIKVDKCNLGSVTDTRPARDTNPTRESYIYYSDED